MRSCHLHTNRLALVHAGPSDFWELWDLWSEADIACSLFSRQHVALDLATTIFESRQSGFPDGLGMWLMKAGNSNGAVGFLSLARRPLPRAEDDTPLHDEVELQVAVRPRARRLGFAFEAARALVRHAFADLDLPGPV